MSCALKTSIRRSYSRLLASSDLSLKRHEPNAPDGVLRSAFDGRGGFLAGVDQVFGQRADDAVAPGVDLCRSGPCAARAVWMTPAAEALMTAVTPPVWA